MNLFRLWGAQKRRDLEWFPPFWSMQIRFLENRNNWRHVRIRLPLGFFTRNFGRQMFGGSQACLADPIAAIACANVFPDFAVWTRALAIDFRDVGDSDLELRFEFEPALEARIREELATRGRSTPTFEYGYYRADGTLCTHIRATVAIRPRGYRSLSDAYTPPAQG